MIIQVVDTTADNNPRISAVALCSTNRRFLGYFCAFFFKPPFLRTIELNRTASHWLHQSQATKSTSLPLRRVGKASSHGEPPRRSPAIFEFLVAGAAGHGEGRWQRRRAHRHDSWAVKASQVSTCFSGINRGVSYSIRMIKNHTYFWSHTEWHVKAIREIVGENALESLSTLNYTCKKMQKCFRKKM
jgi:hypothetical protein